MIGRMIAKEPELYLLDEPTKGVDVEVKEEMYKIFREITSKGATVIFSSLDLSELKRVSDRILIIRNGRVIGEFPPETPAEKLLALAGG